MKPTENEEKYFMERELRLRLERSRAEQAAMAAAEKQKLKELHFMHCPKCGQRLSMEKYGTVEVDVCGGCHGLWLDALELEHILTTKEQAAPWRRFLEVLGVRRQ